MTPNYQIYTIGLDNFASTVGTPGTVRTITFRYDQDFAFIQAILDGHGDIPTFYDGMRCQAVVDAVLQSSQERRWVDVADVPPVTMRLAAKAFLKSA